MSTFPLSCCPLPTQSQKLKSWYKLEYRVGETSDSVTPGDLQTFKTCTEIGLESASFFSAAPMAKADREWVLSFAMLLFQLFRMCLLAAGISVS